MAENTVRAEFMGYFGCQANPGNSDFLFMTNQAGFFIDVLLVGTMILIRKKV
jgi:hypothetical protein